MMLYQWGYKVKLYVYFMLARAISSQTLFLHLPKSSQSNNFTTMIYYSIVYVVVVDLDDEY